MGQELRPHEETGSLRKACERWEFYEQLRTCCLHRGAPVA
jgi:hypothetical protein